MKVPTIFLISNLMSSHPRVQTLTVDNTSNRLDNIDLLFQIGPELPSLLGTVPSDGRWTDQCWFYHS